MKISALNLLRGMTHNNSPQLPTSQITPYSHFESEPIQLEEFLEGAEEQNLSSNHLPPPNNTLINSSHTGPISSNFGPSRTFSSFKMNSTKSMTGYTLNDGESSPSDEKKIMKQPDNFSQSGRKSVISRGRLLSITNSDSMIIIAQSLLTLSTIAFYFLANFGEVALPNAFARLTKQSARVSILIVTLVSTIISAFSSYFFSRAMIRLLQNQLTESPMSLIKLSTILEISRGKSNVKLNFLGHSVLTVIFMILLNTLTASFVALLTPMSIVVHSPIKGVELDFTSSEFDQLLNSSSFLNDTSQTLTSNDPTAFGPLLVSSGMSAAYSQLGFPSLIKFNDAVFNSSTGGILPIGLSGVRSQTGAQKIGSNERTNLGPLPQSIRSRYHVSGQAYLLKDSFSSNHTIHQQGFTSDVKCQGRKVSEPNRPSFLAVPQIINFPGENSTDSLNYTLFRWTFDARCPDERKVDVSPLITAIGTQFDNGGVVAVTLCPDQDLSGNKVPGNHLLTVYGVGGGYGFLESTVCEFKTKVTLVEAEYLQTINIKNITSGLSQSIGAENSRVSSTILSIISSMISQSQTIYTSGFGDVIKSIYNSKSPTPIASFYINSGGANGTLLNEIMEIYFKGQVEFLASYIRASFSAQGIFPADELPIQSRRDVQGRWDSETMGWDRSHRKFDGSLTLIPIILVGLTSIFAVIWPNPKFIPNRKRHKVDQNYDFHQRNLELSSSTSTSSSSASPKKQLDEFNPDNLVELLIAASMGGNNFVNDEDDKDDPNIEKASSVKRTSESDNHNLLSDDDKNVAEYDLEESKIESVKGFKGPLDKVKLAKHPNNLIWKLKLEED